MFLYRRRRRSNQSPVRLDQWLQQRLPCMVVCVMVGILIVNRRFVAEAAFHTSQLTSKATLSQSRIADMHSCAMISYPRIHSSQLYFMNWFGFGSSNSDSNSEMQPPQDLSTLLTILPKDSKNNPPKGTGLSSSNDVVTIMDSMDQLKRAQRIGKITASLVQELKSLTVEGISENGKVKVIYDGQQNPVGAHIDENYYKEKVDVNEFTNALTAAMKDAQTKSVEKMNEKMKNVYNELGFYNPQ